jgi:hypothetical protein
VASSDVDDGYIVMTSQTAGARFLAHATVIDNQTGDTVFTPAISVLAAEPAAASFIPAAEAAFSDMGLFGQGTLPSLETIVGTVQSVGMPGIIAAAAALLPTFTLRVFKGSTVVRTINGTMPEGGETEHYTHVY